MSGLITPKLKSQAIAQLRHRVPIETVADNLELPVPLVREWFENLDEKDLVAVEATAEVVERIMNGEVVGVDNERLSKALEEAAINIAGEAEKPARSGDMLHAKAVQLCADAVAKLYLALVLKGGMQGSGQGSAPLFNDKGLSAFERQLRE